MPVATTARWLIPARWRPYTYLHRLAWEKTQGRIHAGPFQGMAYVDTSVGSAWMPKLIGTYERELHGHLTQACAMSFPLVIDLGAAEGYYAVGLALRLPGARVIAYEAEERGRIELANMAAANGVSARVDVRGSCQLDDLRRDLAGATTGLLLCDVEGAEDVLLCPDQVPELRRLHLLVELHEFNTPGVGQRLRQRFAATHAIEEIEQQSRDGAAEFPFPTTFTGLMPRHYIDWTVSEWRPAKMSWLWMEPSA